jgi:signal transduction histidine kinase
VKSWGPVYALVGGWLAATALVIVLLIDGRSSTLDRVERSTAALAQVLEEHSAGTLQSAKLTLAAIADTWALARPRRHDPRFQELLRQRLHDLPHVRALFLIGADGRLIHDTDYPRTPDVSLADRPYFIAHRDDPGLDTAVSGPYLSRSGGGVGWFVSVTAALRTNGEFRGVAVAAVQPAYFEAIYAKMALTEGDVISLFHRDGTLIARHPAGEQQPGLRFSELSLFTTWLPRASSGSYRVEGRMQPGRRIVAYRAMENLPFVVLMSRSEHAALAEWRRTAVAAGVAMAALTLLLFGVLVREVRRRWRRERERLQRAQAEKLEALGQLTGGIAHDFANLLFVVDTNLHLIALEPADSEAVKRASSVARRAVQRGTEMVSRLLAFAKRQTLELKAADLNSLVTEAHPLIAQAAGARITLELHLAPELEPVLTDESQFEMALLNLVVNARDAMGGRGRILLRTYAAPEGGSCLAVEDEGTGMTRQVRQHAIEPFFTTKGEKGTGLGLAQVYGFMQQSGGSMQIESAPGKGTRVHLRFPRVPELMRIKSAP